jgi:hypothetical protein
MVEQLTFQLGDGGSTPTHPLFHIDKLPHKEAKAFVEKWHYSGKMPTGKNVCFGLWEQGCGLYAAIVYGIGVNPYQAQFLGVESVIEIKRMCRAEPKKKYELSRFIRLTMKLARRYMTFEAVVAFADPEHGHKGTVYSAAGFCHMGVTNPEWHLIDKEGNIRHRRYAYRHARRNKISVQEAREVLEVTRRKTDPKHRWVLFQNVAMKV